MITPYQCAVCKAHGFWTLPEFVKHLSDCIAIRVGLERDLIERATR